MDYDIKHGIWHFKGNEDDLVFFYLWTNMICDMSFLGRIELILRILFARPPERWHEINHNLHKEE